MSKKISINRQRMQTINNNIAEKKATYKVDNSEIVSIEFDGGLPYVEFADSKKLPITMKGLKDLHDKNNIQVN